MNNYEYIKQLDLKGVAKFWNNNSICDFCAYKSDDEVCLGSTCEDGHEIWLKQEHI